MTIEILTTESLTEVVAGLVKNGLTFRAVENGNGMWTITLLGGF
jgi:hypothetical protein